MVNTGLLSLMKPSSYLINTARGPIVNQGDLIQALESNQIAGAGLDVFDEEPLPNDSPLINMNNVILSPHAMAWTDDLYRGNGVGACESVLSVLKGELPRYVVNQEVTNQPGFIVKLQSLGARWAQLSAQNQIS